MIARARRRGLGSMRLRLIGVGAAAAVCGAVAVAWSAPATELSFARPAGFDTPHHGRMDGLAYGGHAELRFGHDRLMGVSDPSWVSIVRVSGFAVARVHSRVRLELETSYDQAHEDYTLERGLADVRLRPALHLQAGVFPVPLGRANRFHDAPRAEFADRSLVATALVGVPSSQLGIGVRGLRARGRGALLWEADLFTGYDHGVVFEGPGATRVPGGRSNFGDDNGVPALAGRVALQPSAVTELGLALQTGPWNQTEIDGIPVDARRWLHVLVADAMLERAGFRIAVEAGAALVDVPDGLEGLYAERQWAAAVEVGRTLRAPLFRRWESSALSAAVRSDAIDFDMAVPGDTRRRLAAGLNLRHRPWAVLRGGWYYEQRRDRFDNDRRAGGLLLAVASYF